VLTHLLDLLGRIIILVIARADLSIAGIHPSAASPDSDLLMVFAV